MADFTLAPFNKQGPRAVGLIQCDAQASVTVEALVEVLTDPSNLYPQFDLSVIGLNGFAYAWHISDLALNANGYVTFTFHNDSAGQQGDEGAFRLSITKVI